MSKTTPILYQCDCCHGYGEIEYDRTPGKKVDCADCLGSGYVTLDRLRTKPTTKTAADFPGPICGILALAKTTHEKGMKGSIPFKIGDRFVTLDGTKVVCIELTDLKGYECARFDDGGYRYNRDHDRGRCTGSSWDCRMNILPAYPVYQEDLLEQDMIRALDELGHLDPGLECGLAQMSIAGVAL